MSYTLGTAAKATGKHITTISKAIKKGKISAVKNDDGSYAIDPAELHRVYPPLSKGQDSKGATGQGMASAGIDHIKELETLRERCKQLEKQIEQRHADVEDYRQRLDRAEQRISALLPASRSRQGFWQWLIGSKTT